MLPPLHSPAAGVEAGEAFRHEAFYYAGEDDFVAGIVPFVEAGLEDGEAVLVIVSARKIRLLRAALGAGAGRVRFADMAAVGANPARIIPAWKDFVEDCAARGQAMRGVGEPIFPERSADELAECHRHESLLNLAFAGARDFWLLCPYDTGALEPAVLCEAQRTHPFLAHGEVRWLSSRYRGLDALGEPWGEPLPEPPGDVFALAFDATTLRAVRDVVAGEAASAGLSAVRAENLTVAVHELASNSVRHGGGGGELRVWAREDEVVCEVRDAGRIDDPMAGRERPSTDEPGGFGLWIATQLCDLVQIRSLPSGGAVRVTMARDNQP